MSGECDECGSVLCVCDPSYIVASSLAQENVLLRKRLSDLEAQVEGGNILLLEAKKKVEELKAALEEAKADRDVYLRQAIDNRNALSLVEIELTAAREKVKEVENKVELLKDYYECKMASPQRVSRLESNLAEVEKVASYRFTHEIEKGNCLTCARWEEVEKERDEAVCRFENCKKNLGNSLDTALRRCSELESRLAEADAKEKNTMKTSVAGWLRVDELTSLLRESEAKAGEMKNAAVEAVALMEGMTGEKYPDGVFWSPDGALAGLKKALLPAPAEVKASDIPANGGTDGV